MNESKVSRGKNVLLCTLAVLIALVLLFPMLWMLNTSLKTEAEIFQNPPTLYPHTLNLKSYIAQIETGDFNMFRSFLNSLIKLLKTAGKESEGSNGKDTVCFSFL